MLKPQAKIETIEIKAGEPFELDWTEEILAHGAGVSHFNDAGEFDGTLILTILRRGV